MTSDLEDKLWKAGSGMTHGESTWRIIIEALLDDFSSFIASDFERDSDVKIDPSASAFRTWIWSKAVTSSPVSVEWSAVMAGGPVGDPSSADSFVVTVDLFLLHELGRKRLYTSDGLHFVQFEYARGPQGKGAWCFLGWQKDEWGEWESVGYPESPPSL